MGHVQDRWWKEVEDPDTREVVRVKTSLYGTGLRYKVRYIDPEGVERSKSFPDRQKKKAEDFLIEMESDKREGKYIDPNAGKVLFKVQAESWLNGYSPDAATRQTVRSRLRSQIYPYFGHRSLVSIKPQLVRDWLGDMQEKGLSLTYQALLFETFSSVMNSAVDDKRIHQNPCNVKSIKRPQRSPRKVVPWPESRLHKIQLALDARFKIVAPLGAGCGLRQGEILAFSPEDIDREAKVINVQRQVRIIDRVAVFSLPKRNKERQVPLSQGVLEAVDDYMEMFPPTAVTLPWDKPNGELVTVNLLMVRADGKVCHGDLFNKVVWVPAFKQAGLIYTKRQDGMHAMRHLYASVLLAQGVSIKELAEYLGHEDPGFTLRTYTHLMPSSHERARKAVDGVFRARKTPSNPRTA
ncbi:MULTISPECIES: tyrosine-type recombinase/integrase [unclassified Saccharothrix]|uniref:tyrosine-type recombinase/integrase n=1 Tax=unclassified Saccharothrix TaxID=2593673 RepID=UPI00307F4808